MILSTFGNLTFNPTLADGEGIKAHYVYALFLVMLKRKGQVDYCNVIIFSIDGT